MGQAQGQAQNLYEQGDQTAACDPQQQDEGQLPQRVETDGGNREFRQSARKSVTQAGGADGGYQHRRKADYRVFGDDHLHGEHHTCQGRVERGGNAGRRATGDDNALTVVG